MADTGIYDLSNNAFFTKDKRVSNPDRYLGGSTIADYHPYVKGYFYVFFQFPPIMKSYNAKTSKSSSTLLSLCEGFTPPGDRQLKTEDVTGVGGVDATFVVGQTIDRSFSLMYRDIWGSPIFVYHRAWTSIIDPFLGGLRLKGDVNDFVPAAYKGKVMVVQTKPIALKTNTQSESLKNSKTEVKWENYIIKAHLFDGVVPVTDLNSVYDSNINDNTIVRPSVQYRFDGKEYDETVSGVLKTAADLMKTLTITNRQTTKIVPSN
jgi:hypothetical protein